MPRRNTRAYYQAKLLAHVKRVFGNLRDHHLQEGRSWLGPGLDQLRSVIPDTAILRIIDETLVGKSWQFDLDISAVSTEELARAAARIQPARPGRPLGHLRPIENIKLLKRLDAAVEAGEGSVRAVCERLAKRHGVSAEGLRKQYQRYRKRMAIPI